MGTLSLALVVQKVVCPEVREGGEEKRSIQARLSRILLSLLAILMLDSLRQVSSVEEKPRTATEVKGKILKVEKSAGGPHFHPERLGNGSGEGSEGRKQRNRNKNSELAT